MSNLTYEQYLASKSKVFTPVGIDNATGLSGMLWDYQQDIVERNLYAGRFLNMLDCGLGKTPIQLEWVHKVAEETKKPVLTVAPLQVCYQTVRESHKFNRPVVYYKSPPKHIGENIITNYENIHKFNPNAFSGINLDESSILKGHGSKTRFMLNDFAENMRFRLSNSATAAPNDLDETLRQAVWLGITTFKEAQGEYFVKDSKLQGSSKYRLKRPAVEKYWDWFSSWCVAMQMPSDLGYSNDHFVRGKLFRHNAIVKYDKPLNGMLVALPAKKFSERQKARRDTIEVRCQLAAKLLNNADAMAQYVPDYDVNEPVVIWCDRDKESQTLTKLINGAVEVTGSQSAEDKAQRMLDFSDGKITKLVTKPKIAGHGMNWQHSRIMLFVGLSDSFEQVYQATRRLWRNMQMRDVHAIFITSSLEGEVLRNQERKFKQHQEMYKQLVARVSEHWTRTERTNNIYNPQNQIILPNWL